MSQSSWPIACGESADRVRTLDWSSTPIGSSENWPAALRTMVEQVLESQLIAWLAIGSHRVFIYNDAAASWFGRRHPSRLGLPLADAFPHAFHKAAAIYDRVFTGESICILAQPFHLTESEMPEMPIR